MTRSTTLALVVSVALLAAVVRVESVATPLVGSPWTMTIRSHHSFLLARSLFVDWGGETEAWQRAAAEARHPQAGVLEPPILESASAVGYLVVGRELPWLPGALSVAIWFGGAWFVYRLARRLAWREGALAASATFLLLPFAVRASAVFQPDPLMVTMTMAGALTIVRHDEHPSYERLAVAAVVAGAAALVKPPMALFFLFPLFAVLSIRRHGFVAARRAGPWCFAVVAALPSVAYYLQGVLWSDNLSGHVGDKVRPRLLLSGAFWHGWWEEVTEVLRLLNRAPAITSAVVLVAAAAGLWIAARRGTAWLLLALWAGYACFGLVFTAHIHTHSYYSLPLVPIVALSIAPLADQMVVIARRWSAGLRASGTVAVALGLLLVLGLTYRREASDANRNREQIQRFERLGAVTGHTESAVFLGIDQGYAVSYHGSMSGRLWPTVASFDVDRGSARARFASTDATRHYPAIAGMRPAPTHFVITMKDELVRQPDLAELLDREHRLVYETEDDMVYELRQPR